MSELVFVNAVYFNDDNNIHLGQFILRDILKKHYSIDCINFDLLNKNGAIKYKESFLENIKIMGEYILNLSPRVVGFYTICNAFIPAVKIAEYIKEKNKEIKVFFGGPQATVTSYECLEAFPFIDAICLGESERTIEQFVDTLWNQKSFAAVPGVAYRSEKKIRSNPCAELIGEEQLEKYTVFDYTPFNINKEARHRIEGGRGCPFGCTFCTTSTFWGRHYRVKPVDVILNEMVKCNEIYGVKHFGIEHDMFTVNRQYILHFCKNFRKRGLPFDWTCSSRVDVLDEELIDCMTGANCVGIYLGIETGSARIQKIINKNLNLKNAVETIRYICSKRQCAITASFIFCYPDETIEDFKETIKLMEELLLLSNRITVQLHRFIPLPSTEETEKIKDRIYFDETTLEATQDNISLEEVKDLVLEYPNMFSQYYTFDSPVKEYYKRFDSFILLIDTVKEFYSNCFLYLIKKYGLETLFFRIEEYIENVYLLLNRIMEVTQNTINTPERRFLEINMAIEPFWKREVELDQTVYFEELYEYERYKSIFYYA